MSVRVIHAGMGEVIKKNKKRQVGNG